MEVVEGEAMGDHGILFKRAGSELRVVQGGFTTTTTIPSQALAISNKFGLTFFLHSEGFYLAKTQDLVQASQTMVDSDEEYNAKDNALANIHLPCIEFLALSKDELVIAACTEDKINFYSVPALAQKGKEGLEDGTALVKLMGEEHGIKVLAWNAGQGGVILLLSKEGKLRLGPFTEHHLKVVAEEVEAVDWSPDGEYFCYITKDKHLHICHSESSSRCSSSKLPQEMFSEEKDGGLDTNVATLTWVRSDSILVSCVAKDMDDEENSRIFVLASNAGPVAKDLHNSKIVSFTGFFTTMDSSILPSKTGPYTLSNYIQPWELLIVTSRRCVDDHITLIGWFKELGESQVYRFELVDDRYTPRIELQASGAENCVVGLAVDTTTRSIEIPAPNGDSGDKLKPGPVLFCMTLEGNLNLFSIARMDNKRENAEILSAVSELPEASEVLLNYSLDCKVSGETALAIESIEHKSNSSVSNMAEQSGSGLDGHGGKASANESCLDKSLFAMPKVEHTHSQQPKKHPTTVMEGGDAKKQDSLKESKREDVQGKPKEIHSQRQAQGPVEVYNRPVSPAFTKTSDTIAMSEMESEVFRELNKVKGMAMEIESLMNFIEGKQRLPKGELEPSFTKASVEEIECKARTMYKQCESFREHLVDLRQTIVDLRDESLQVDAWRVYVQSILEQAFDVRYKELWNKQTLHPELAGMRKRILQADQSLKQQIAELEEHLHNLELYQWQKTKPSRIPPALSASKNFGCMQSLYDTVNTQMAVAQQLARRLALQSEILKIPPLAKEEMDGSMNTSMLKLQNMTLEEHPAAKTRARLSSSERSDFSPVRTTLKSSLQTPSKQAPPAGTRAGLQDSTRRRRDSVDKLWVDVGAAKTTVKRAAPAKRFNRLSSPSAKDVVQSKGSQLQNERLCRDTSPVMTDISAIKLASPEARPKQARASVQFGAEASRAKDYRKSGNNDTGTAQSIKQKMSQSAIPATTVVTTSWPSTTKPTSPQGQVPLCNKSMSHNSREQESQTVFFPKQATHMGFSSIGSTTQTTAGLKGNHIESPRNTDVGKRDLFQTAAVTSASHEKGSLSSKKSPFAFINESEKTSALNNMQSDATVKQQQGALESSVMSIGLGFGQSASQVAGSNLMKFANLQAHSVASGNNELKESDKKSAIEGSKEISEGHTTRLFLEAGTGSVLTSSGTLVRSLSSSEQSSGPLFLLQRESLPISTSQGLCSSTFAPISLVQPSLPESTRQPSPPKSTRQPWGSSSSESSSSSSLLTKPSTFMSSFSSAQEASSAPLPSAGVCSQTSSSVDVFTISSVKPPNAFPNSIIPAEKSQFPSTASISTSFLPAQGPPTLSDEEEMEEEGNNINYFESSSFAGFGLGPSSAATSQNANPFGMGSTLSPAASKPLNAFGAASVWNPSSPSSMSASAGQVFKPAGFSLPTPQLGASSSTSTLFNNNLSTGSGGSFNSGFGSSAQPSVAFSNPTQPSASGQQALGNALGSFGQTRQIGSPFNVSASPSGFGVATGGGFASAPTSGGFASAPSGGGFAGVASSSGFANIAAGGGFASAATGSGFASFSGAGLGTSSSSNVIPGGFGAFSGGAFSAFGGGNTNSSIFTQMRK